MTTARRANRSGVPAPAHKPGTAVTPFAKGYEPASTCSGRQERAHEVTSVDGRTFWMSAGCRQQPTHRLTAWLWPGYEVYKNRERMTDGDLVDHLWSTIAQDRQYPTWRDVCAEHIGQAVERFAGDPGAAALVVSELPVELSLLDLLEQ